MRRKKKQSIYALLAVLVLMISIGYAYLSTNLKINGTSKIHNATWDVHFENAEATANSTVTPTTAPSAPAASKLQEISYDVTFDTPGDIYEFTVDVVNGGRIDAMIESFTSKIKVGDAAEQDVSASTLPSYLDYAVTYEDGTAIANNHLLAAGDTETIKVTVTFKRDITNAQLEEAAGKTITLNLGTNYVQADKNAQEVSRTITGIRYTTNIYDYSKEGYNSVWINQKMPSDITFYETVAEARANYNNSTIYLKHKIENDIVTESYVCFEKDSNTYCLRGLDGYGDEDAPWECKSEYRTSEEECMVPYYESNKEVLISAFGSSRCGDEDEFFSNGTTFYDFGCGGSGFAVNVHSDGYVHVEGGGVNSYIERYGYSYLSK